MITSTIEFSKFKKCVMCNFWLNSIKLYKAQMKYNNLCMMVAQQ